MKREELVQLAAPYTQIAAGNLSWLYDFCREQVTIPGAVVQCGVLNGGSAVVIWAGCGGGERELWMFDSWKGLPKPSEEDEGRAFAKYDYMMATHGSWCKGEIALAREIARKAGVPKEQAHFVKGWFSNTLMKWSERIGPIAMLYLDADWYQSTLECLRWLYPKLASGGVLVLDDYGYWPGCTKAAQEYGIDEMLVKRPGSGAYLVKL